MNKVLPIIKKIRNNLVGGCHFRANLPSHYAKYSNPLCSKPKL